MHKKVCFCIEGDHKEEKNDDDVLCWGCFWGATVSKVETGQKKKKACVHEHKQPKGGVEKAFH